MVGKPSQHGHTVPGRNSDKTKESYDVSVGDRITWHAHFVRCCFLIFAIVCTYFADVIQIWINSLWKFLLSTWVFHSVYFESWFATFCYAVIIPVYPFALHQFTFLNKYKVDPSVTYIHHTVLGMFKDGVIYVSPLMLLDTFMVKKYCGVNPDIWVEKRKSLIQTTRALPEDPPTFFIVVVHLIGSVLVFDALFFFIHLALHRNYFLYKNFHAVHHEHDIMHAHVTNQLTVSERITLILSANFSLKVFNSHPLTRFFFVPGFLWLLVDNHTGYDLPWGLHKIVPFRIMGGPRKHYAHHLEGARHYQPFLCYLDKLLENKKLKFF